MNIHRDDLDNDERCKKIVDYKYAPLRARIAEVVKVDSQTKVMEAAGNIFDSVFEPTKKNLRDWTSVSRASLQSAISEIGTVKSERDSVEKDIRAHIDREVPMTGGEKFEYYLLMTGAIILWVVGYLSAVQVLKSIADSITPLAVWLLPLAGVTVMGLLIKILLSRLQGTKAFNVLLLILIAVGLTASLFWLFTFSEFVGGIAAQPTGFGGIDSSGSGSAGTGHTSMLYIIVSVLGETIGAAACYAYASNIRESKTIWSMEPNPEWQTKNDHMDKLTIERNKLDDIVSNCVELDAYIDGLRDTFHDEARQAFEARRDSQLADEASSATA
jgi:hypothetical protein